MENFAAIQSIESGARLPGHRGQDFEQWNDATVQGHIEAGREVCSCTG
jgi:hypothetical protein